MGQGLLIIEDSWSISDTLHLVWLLWMSDKPDAETSTWQHTTLTTDRHPCLGRDSNPQSQQASGRRPMPYGVYTPTGSSAIQSSQTLGSRGVHTHRVESIQVCACSSGFLVHFEKWIIRTLKGWKILTNLFCTRLCGGGGIVRDGTCGYTR